jgi:hypothetical protein
MGSPFCFLNMDLNFSNLKNPRGENLPQIADITSRIMKLLRKDLSCLPSLHRSRLLSAQCCMELLPLAPLTLDRN